MSKREPAAAPGVQAPRALPKVVRRYWEEAANATGITPSVETPEQGLWRMSVANERVCTTVDFRTDRTGKTKYADSTLTVDGQPRELARDAQELAQIFTHPSGERVLDPAPNNGTISAAPILVQRYFRNLTDRLGGASVTTGQKKDGTWVIGMDGPNAQLRLNFRHDHMHVELVVDGIDRTRDVEDSLEDALALVNGILAPIEDSQAPQGQPAPAARSNAVETRRGTVLRL